MKNIFKGMGVALLTPFRPALTPSGCEVDYEKIEELVEYIISNGADFICLLGSTAETACLSAEEKKQIKDVVCKSANKRVPLLIGMGDNNTSRLIEEINSFDFTGIDGILSVCPFYNKPRQEGIYQHYKAIASSTNLPIVMYNVPSRTGTNIVAETTIKLAKEVPNIVAIKEASGNIEQIRTIIEAEIPDFDVISGDDGLTYDMICMGAVGVISVIGNALPKKFSDMVHGALKNNYKEAIPIHHQLTDAYNLLCVDGNPAGIKSMMSAMGMIENILRLPLVKATDNTYTKFQNFLSTL